jgi:hypothetical protein
MILYLAGQASEVKDMVRKLEYEHVLFSRLVHSKRNLLWMKKRKEEELCIKPKKRRKKNEV